MKTGKIILIILILIVILGLFLNYAFNKIQLAELDITKVENKKVSQKLLEYIKEMQSMSDVEFIGGIKFLDDNIQILLVDHVNEEAAILCCDEYYAVDYGKLDKSIVYCNSYSIYVDKQPTIIINCDEILDDPVERAVISVYQFKAGGFETLDPMKADYFSSLELDEKECYLRYKMSDSLRTAYFGDGNLESFSFYYRSWVNHLEEKNHDEIINYDYYDGIREYIRLQVRLERDVEYNIGGFIDSFKNEYGIYDKNDEHKVLGLLWCLMSERLGMDLLQDDSIRTDRYKILLKDTPYADFEDEDDGRFSIKFNKMVHDMEILITEVNDAMVDVVPRELLLTSETYENVLMLDKNHFIYRNYKARDEHSNLIEVDNMLVRISPYKIEHYINGK